MAEYAAHVTTDLERVDDEHLDRLVEVLAPQAGVPSMLGGRLSVQLTVDVDSLDLALSAAAAIVLRAVTGTLSVPVGDWVHVVGVEVLERAEFERRLALPVEAPDLISTVEAADVLDVSRQRVLQLVNDHPEFPEPVRRGSRGMLHSRAALLRFLEVWDRTAGPRQKTGAGS